MWRFIGFFVGLCSSVACAQTPPSNDDLVSERSSEFVYRYSSSMQNNCSSGVRIFVDVTAEGACRQYVDFLNTSSFRSCSNTGGAYFLRMTPDIYNGSDAWYCNFQQYQGTGSYAANVFVTGRYVTLSSLNSVCVNPRQNFASILDVAGMSSTCDVDAAGNKCWYRYNGAPTQTVTYYDYVMGSGVTCPEGQTCTKTVYYRYNVELTGAVCTTSAAQANESARQAVTERQRALGTAIDALENAAPDGSTGGELKAQTDRVVEALGTVEVSVDGVKGALTSLQTVAEEIQRLAGKIDTNTAATSIATDAVQQAVGGVQAEVARIGADIVHAVQSQSAQSPDLSPILSAMEMARLGAAERTAALNKLVDEAAKARQEREKQTELLQKIERAAENGPNFTPHAAGEPWSIYDRAYPDGLAGVWQRHQSTWQNNPALALLHSYSVQYRSYTPSWTFDLGQYGRREVSIPQYVIDALYWFVLLCASGYALRIVFGR